MQNNWVYKVLENPVIDYEIPIKPEIKQVPTSEDFLINPMVSEEYLYKPEVIKGSSFDLWIVPKKTPFGAFALMILPTDREVNAYSSFSDLPPDFLVEFFSLLNKFRESFYSVISDSAGKKPFNFYINIRESDIDLTKSSSSIRYFHANSQIPSENAPSNVFSLMESKESVEIAHRKNAGVNVLYNDLLGTSEDFPDWKLNGSHSIEKTIGNSKEEILPFSKEIQGIQELWRLVYFDFKKGVSDENFLRTKDSYTQKAYTLFKKQIEKGKYCLEEIAKGPYGKIFFQIDDKTITASILPRELLNPELSTTYFISPLNVVPIEGRKSLGTDESLRPRLLDFNNAIIASLKKNIL